MSLPPLQTRARRLTVLDLMVLVAIASLPLAALGTAPVPVEQATPKALASHLAAEVPRWGAVIKGAGVKPN